MALDQPIVFASVLGEVPATDDDDEIIYVGEPWSDVVWVEVTGPLTLFVRFEDGIAGKVRFEPSYLTGVFDKLKDPAYFARAGILYGAVSWPNELPDLAPDVMYDAVKSKGEWVLA